jgi:hypothetical protein
VPQCCWIATGIESNKSRARNNVERVSIYVQRMPDQCARGTSPRRLIVRVFLSGQRVVVFVSRINRMLQTDTTGNKSQVLHAASGYRQNGLPARGCCGAADDRSERGGVTLRGIRSLSEYKVKFTLYKRILRVRIKSPEKFRARWPADRERV